MYICISIIKALDYAFRNRILELIRSLITVLTMFTFFSFQEWNLALGRVGDHVALVVGTVPVYEDETAVNQETRISVPDLTQRLKAVNCPRVMKVGVHEKKTFFKRCLKKYRITTGSRKSG